jgi:hypothetical protein
LKVAKPKALVLRQRKTVIEGEATPGAVININRVRVAVDKAGKFHHTVTLNEGQNPITVVLEDVTGRTKEATLPAITVDTKPPDIQSKIRWGKTSPKKVRKQ